MSICWLRCNRLSNTRVDMHDVCVCVCKGQAFIHIYIYIYNDPGSAATPAVHNCWHPLEPTVLRFSSLAVECKHIERLKHEDSRPLQL